MSDLNAAISQLTDERDYYRQQLEVIERKLRENSPVVIDFINRAMAEIPNLTDDEKRAVNRAWKDGVYSSAIGAQIVLMLKPGDPVPLLRKSTESEDAT